MAPRRSLRTLRRLGAVFLIVFVIAILLLLVALSGSHGHLPAIIDGQFDPGPALTDLDVSANPPPGPQVRVRVTVDSSTVVRRVDPSYLSFAIDTSAVVGGKWWDPKAESTELGSGTVNAPVFDFDRPRLDALTRALAPAYLRIGGSEADKVYYDLSGSGQEQVPEGYESVLTRPQWDSVNAFARRNGLSLVMTLNAGPSSRGPDKRWVPDNAEALLRYSRSSGFEVAMWELGNELNLFWFVFGLGDQVSADVYAEDLRRLRAVVADSYPNARVNGQSAAFWPVLGEPLGVRFGFQAAYVRRSGQDTDTLGWHYYPQQSRRGPFASRRASPGRLLDPNNLDEVAHWAQHNARLRDAHSPGRPLWLGETGHAQFGGEPGLSDRYLASLWWLDQLGLLAVHEHDVVVRQTLCGSNYQMITDDTLMPLPDYWASILWKRLMGRGVLATKVSGSDKVRAYAHLTPDQAGVTALIINLDHQRVARIEGLDLEGARLYAVTSTDLFGTLIRLNGEPVSMVDDTTLPVLAPVPAPSPLLVHPLSYTFVTVGR